MTPEERRAIRTELARLDTRAIEIMRLQMNESLADEDWQALEDEYHALNARYYDLKDELAEGESLLPIPVALAPAAPSKPFPWKWLVVGGLLLFGVLNYSHVHKHDTSSAPPVLRSVPNYQTRPYQYSQPATSYQPTVDLKGLQECQKAQGDLARLQASLAVAVSRYGNDSFSAITDRNQLSAATYSVATACQ